MTHHLNTQLAVLGSVLLLAALVAEVRHDLRRLLRGRSVVLAGIFAWFLLEALKPGPEVAKFDQSIYDFSVFCVILAAVSFLLGYHYTQGCLLIDKMSARIRLLDDPRLLWRVVSICAAVGFLPILYYSGLQITALISGILGMRVSWGGLLARGRYGGFREAMLMLEMFVTGAGPFAVILLLHPRVSPAKKAACLVIAGWPLLRAYGSATRSSMLTALLPALAVIYFRFSPRVQKGILVTGICLAPLVYTFMAAMVVSRGTGQFSWKAAREAKYVGNEMFQELVYITANVPKKVEYQMGHSYFVQLVNPIPRFLWPGKPRLDSGILMAKLKGEVLASGETYLTRSPGLIGEMYLNLGLLGVIGLSAFGGWMVKGWDRIPLLHGGSLPTMIFFCLGLSTLFILGRSFTMNMFYGIMFFFVGVTAITWMSGVVPRPTGGALAAARVRQGGGRPQVVLNSRPGR